MWNTLCYILIIVVLGIGPTNLNMYYIIYATYLYVQSSINLIHENEILMYIITLLI